MSEFRQDLMMAFHSPASFESADSSEDTQAAPAPEVITHDDILEAREDREEVQEVVCEVVDAVEDDLKFIDAADSVASIVSGTAEAASNVGPAQAEAFVAVANGAIEDASKILGTEIPQLANVSDGSVDQASMESLTSWMSTAAKAFSDASGRFFTRLKTGWMRLNTSVGGFKGRIDRVRTKMVGRKGTGGKALKLDRDIVAALILGDKVATDPMAAANQLAEVVSQASAVVAEYQNRTDSKIKAAVFEAVAGNEGETFLAVEQQDLVTKLEAIVKNAPPLLLGNQKLEQLERRLNPVLRFGLTGAAPSAVELAKHVDPIVSLSNEQIRDVIDKLTPAVTEYLRQVEKLAELAERSQTNCKAMLGRLLKQPEGGDDTELDVEFNDTSLLRIENELVGELARISSRQMQYAGAVIAAYNAVLTVVEESIFQD